MAGRFLITTHPKDEPWWFDCSPLIQAGVAELAELTRREIDSLWEENHAPNTQANVEFRAREAVQS